MPRNDVTAEYVRDRLDYDPETGIFRWKTRSDVLAWWNTKFAGGVAGRAKEDGRIVIKLDSKAYFAHRLAWLVTTGEWPESEIDHKNLDAGDNRFANLREATGSQNCSNRPGRLTLKGAFWHTRVKKWHSSIGVDRKRISLGYFDTQLEAHAAYVEAAKRYHGEFARAGR